MKKLSLFSLLLAVLMLTLVMTGCGNKENRQPQQQTLKIENFSFTGEKRVVEINGVPKRVVVCGNSAADTLKALGAADSIHTLILTEPREADKYKKDFPKANIEVRPLAQEVLLALKPDLIIAHRRYFSDKVMGGPSFWSQRKIPTYIQDASGPIPSLKGFPPCTIESEKNFITNMGKIFCKEAEAKAIIEKISTALQNAPKTAKKPTVFVVEFMGKNIELFGKPLLIGNIVEQLGAEIVDIGHPFLSREELYMIKSDVVFVVYHGGPAEKELALKQVKSSVVGRMAAVQQGRIYPLNYKTIVCPGVNVVDTIKYVNSKL